VPAIEEFAKTWKSCFALFVEITHFKELPQPLTTVETRTIRFLDDRLH
jgi:hypothetical protein